MKLKTIITAATLSLISTLSFANGNLFQASNKTLNFYVKHGESKTVDLHDAKPGGILGGPRYNMQCSTQADSDVIVSFQTFPAPSSVRWQALSVNDKPFWSNTVIPMGATVTIESISYSDMSIFSVLNLDNETDINFQCVATPVVD